MDEMGTKRRFDSKVACVFGVSEAIVLEQIRYWIDKKNENKKEYKSSFRDGRCWVYNSYRGWHEQMPFLSEHTIRRALYHLIECGVLIKGNYNKLAYDNTNWYTVDEEKLTECLTESGALVQNGQAPVQNGQVDVAKMDRPIPTTTHTISTTITSESDRAESCKTTLCNRKEEVFSFEVLNRQIRKVCKEMDKEKYASGVYALFRMYYNYYAVKMKREHKYLKDKNLMDAINILLEHYLPADKDDVLMCYQPMVWEYFFGNNNFTGNEKGECDYSILHFLSTLEYREYNAERSII